MRVNCECGRGRYDTARFRSCWDCYLDRREGHVQCILCGARWHNPGYDACYQCQAHTRDRGAEAAKLRQLILHRDNYACRSCGVHEGETQIDPRYARLACPFGCATPHNHRLPCPADCDAEHTHTTGCPPGCAAPHIHRLKDDDGTRRAMMQVDRIVPREHGGSLSEWNLHTLCGVCKAVRSPWSVGCAYEEERTSLAKAYLLIADVWFGADEQRQLRLEWAAYKHGPLHTWDPAAQHEWLTITARGTCRSCGRPMVQYDDGQDTHPSCPEVAAR